MTDLRTLFAAHIDTVCKHAEKALNLAAEHEARYDGIVFHAGTQGYYHADDRTVFFKPVPHFARFAPLQGPEHVLLFKPGAKPKLWQVVPADYWYEPPAQPKHPYAEVLDVTQVGSRDEAIQHLGDVSKYAYVGDNPRAAAAMRIALENIEPKTLMAALDWYRAEKTPYEVHCVREAARRAGAGHAVVREGFARGDSERTLHANYLDATGMLELDAPYTNIIAWDEGAAILHYQSKRAETPDPGAVLLIDAGAVHDGYASDITRTYANARAHPVFHDILDRMDAMQLQLVEKVGPGRAYLDLHVHAHQGVAQILCDTGILKTSPDEAMERKLTLPFLPHGVGHHLGIQVHDVGGKQVTPRGDRKDPPPEHPYLRTTRPLEPGHIVTIEPGLYFIPLLLDPKRNSADKDAFDWKLIDALTPCGGVRVEDDVLVTADGFDNLSRPFVPGHRNGA